MRAALALVILLAAGCASPAEDAALPAAAPAPPPTALHRLVVVTVEYLPVAQASVSLARDGTTWSATSDDEGFVELPVPAGAYLLTAVREGYLTNETTLELPAEPAPEAVPIFLERAPLDHYRIEFPFVDGWCAAYRIDPLRDDRTCQRLLADDPDDVVGFNLDGSLHSATIDIRREPGSLQAARTLRFEARILGDGPLALADGRDELVAEGASPLRIEFPEELVADSPATAGQRLEVRAFPGDDPGPHGYSQKFHVYGTIVTYLGAQ